MEKRRRNKTPNQSKRILFPQNFIHCCWILLYIARESEKKLYGTHILLTRIKECIRSIKLAHEICTDIRAINRSTHTHTHTTSSQRIQCSTFTNITNTTTITEQQQKCENKMTQIERDNNSNNAKWQVKQQ